MTTPGPKTPGDRLALVLARVQLRLKAEAQARLDAAHDGDQTLPEGGATGLSSPT